MAAAIAAGSMLQLEARTGTDTDGRTTIEVDQGFLAEAAKRLTEQSASLFEAIRAEEATLWRGRRDPWREPLSSLEEFVWLCWALVDFPSTIQPNSPSRELVAEFQLEACRIATEICYLMRGGFYASATARWRAIHELVVFAEFMWRFGDEAARRFRAHEATQELRLAKALNRHGPAWGMTPLTPERTAEVELASATAVDTYGKELGASDYGWAAGFLGARATTAGAPGNPPAVPSRRGTRRVLFTDLEEAVGTTRWQAYGTLASAYVHARLPAGPDIPGNDSLSLRLSLVKPGDGHIGALTALSLCSLTQTLIDLSADRSDETDKVRVSLVAGVVEQVRQQLDRQFTQVEKSLESASVEQ